MLLRTLRFAATMLLASGFAHWILGRWAMRVFPSARAHRRVVQGVGVALVVSPILARIATLVVKLPAEHLLAATMMEFMLAGIASAPFALYEVAALATRTWRARANASLREPRDAAEAKVDAISRREAVERVAGLAVLGSTGAALGWGMVRGRHAFEVEEVPVRIVGLPRVLDGYTIAQVSDIHVGLFVGDRELDEGLERVRALKPDMIVATGDLVDYDPRFAPVIARALSALAARDGVFAILGNHDYYTGHAEVRRALAATKVDLLVNAGRRIRPMDGGGFALLGTDDAWANLHGGEGFDLARAIAMVPRDVPRILLAHQPKCFDWAAGEVALQLSGHTHGGQINPGIRPATWFMRYVAGRYEERGSTLWVNRGFGVAGPPARIGAPPEVTKVVLVAA